MNRGNSWGLFALVCAFLALVVAVTISSAAEPDLQENNATLDFHTFLKLALDRSHKLKAASLGAEAAFHEYLGQKYLFWPTLKFYSEYGWQDDELGGSTAGEHAGQDMFYEWGASFNFPLLREGTIFAYDAPSIERKWLDWQISSLDIRILKQEEVEELARSFVDVVRAEEHLRLQRKSLEFYGWLLQKNKELLKAKKISLREKEISELNYDAARQLYESQKQKCYLLKSKLALELGIDEQIMLHSCFSLPPALTPLPDKRLVMERLIKKGNPALERAEMERKQAYLEYEEQRRSVWPTLDLALEWNNYEEGDEKAVFLRLDWTWGLDTYHKSTAARLKWRQKEEDCRALLAGQKKSLLDSLFTLYDLHSAIKQNQIQIRMLEMKLENLQTYYEQGNIDLQPLMQAALDLFAARDDYLMKRTDYFLQAISLKHKLGMDVLREP